MYPRIGSAPDAHTITFWWDTKQQVMGGDVGDNSAIRNINLTPCSHLHGLILKAAHLRLRSVCLPSSVSDQTVLELEGCTVLGPLVLPGGLKTLGLHLLGASFTEPGHLPAVANHSESLTSVALDVFHSHGGLARPKGEATVSTCKSVQRTRTFGHCPTFDHPTSDV